MNNVTLSALKSRGYQMINGQLVRPDSHDKPRAFISSTSDKAAKMNVPKAKREPSALSLSFQARWKGLNGPELTPEYKFHASRRWRFDFVHLPTMTAIELEGGIFMRGRHSRPKGMQNDCDKYNAAATLGYTVFRIATGQVTRERLNQIIQTISSRAQPTAPT